MRFDFTGLGGSEGEFANTDFSSNVADLVAAARWLESEHRAPSLLVGHSFGGAAVLAAAAQMPSVTAVATINAPSDPAHLENQFAGHEEEIRVKGAAQIDLGGRPFTIRREFLEDIAAQKIMDAVTGLQRALLVMHAPGDAVVSVDHASAIFRAARHPKSFISLDTADHLLTRREDARYAAPNAKPGKERSTASSAWSRSKATLTTRCWRSSSRSRTSARCTGRCAPRCGFRRGWRSRSRANANALSSARGWLRWTRNIAASSRLRKWR